MTEVEESSHSKTTQQEMDRDTLKEQQSAGFTANGEPGRET